jgi:ADP-heptose:LPS heptosyltransferase
MKTRPKNTNLKKSYAIFVRSSYGDLLMVDPLVKYIKQLNKNNTVDLFIEEKNYQLVEFMENINNYYSLPSKGNKYLFFTFFGLINRKNKYDFSIAAKTGTGSANGFFPFMLGAKKQISYVSKKKTWTDRLVNCPVYYDEGIYEKQHYALSVLQLLDSNIKNIPESLYPKLKLEVNSKDSFIPKVLISLSNNRKSCILENDKISSIINQLSKEFEFEVIISVLQTDHQLAMNLKKQLNLKSTICQTPILRDYLKLINSVDICFFGEGGSMHMAAALGIPQVVLFGETSLITWAPLSKGAAVLYDKSNVNNIPKQQILNALKVKLNMIRIT